MFGLDQRVGGPRDMQISDEHGAWVLSGLLASSADVSHGGFMEKPCGNWFRQGGRDPMQRCLCVFLDHSFVAEGRASNKRDGSAGELRMVAVSDQVTSGDSAKEVMHRGRIHKTFWPCKKRENSHGRRQVACVREVNLFLRLGKVRIEGEKAVGWNVLRKQLVCVRWRDWRSWFMMVFVNILPDLGLG